MRVMSPGEYEESETNNGHKAAGPQPNGLALSPSTSPRTDLSKGATAPVSNRKNLLKKQVFTV